LGITFSRTGQAEADYSERPESKPVDFFEDTRSMIRDSPLTRTLTDPEDLYSEGAGPSEDAETPPPEAELPEFAEGDLEDDVAVPPEPRNEETLTPFAGLDEAGSDELPSDEEESGASIDYLEPSQESSRDEMEFADRRSFESDFELVEPRPFDTDMSQAEPERSEKTMDEHEEISDLHEAATEWEKGSEYEFPEEKLPEALDQLERDFSSHGLTISPTEPVLTEEGPPVVEKERMVDVAESTHETRRIPESDEVEIPVACEDTETHDVDVEQEPPEVSKSPLSERKAIWSPYDEPSALEEEPDEDESLDEGPLVEDELDDITEEEPPAEPEIKAPPPPPPPPESGETEEERRRRARRLFFGT
jgi:hypothetical protein